MKFLFVATGSPATFHAVAPLATAVRNAGHEVVLAAHEPWMETVEAIGIPTVCYSPEPIRHFMKPSRPGKARIFPRNPREQMLDVGRGFARMTSAGLRALLDLAEDWRPDLVVGSSMSYVAGLVGTRLGVPYVRHVEYLGIAIADIDPGAEEGLQPELKRLGLARLPDPALSVDVTPPSLMPPYDPGAQPMRWIPSNPQRRLEPWMYTRPEGRHRVLITSEFRAPGWSMRNLVDQLARAGAEVLIEASDEAAKTFDVEQGAARIGWIPLDVVAPTCDLAVQHAGAATAMTVMAAGVPQLIIPPNDRVQAIAHALSGFGAGVLVMLPEQALDADPADAIAAGCREILSTPRYAQQARALAAEIAALPTPAQVVHMLETHAAHRAVLSVTS